MTVTKFYGWYIQIWDSGYDEWDYPVYKYVIRIGKYFLHIDKNDYPKQTEKENEATLFIKPSEVLQKLTDLTATESNYIGWIQNCPKCQEKVQTTCSACGCGRCLVCDYRFVCNPYYQNPNDHVITTLPFEIRFPQIDGSREGDTGIA